MDARARGLEDVVIGESAVSRVGGETGHLSFRGYDITEVVEHLGYEGTVHLLLRGGLPEADPPPEMLRELARRRSLPPEVERLVDALPAELPPIDALRTGISSLGGGRFPYPPTLEQGLELIAQAPTLLARFHRRRTGQAPVPPDPELGHVRNYLHMLEDGRPDPTRVWALESYFDLIADHGMNASTFALRVVLSTNADLISAATAGVGALKGPLHGGAPERVLEMLDAVGREENVGPWLRGAFERRERLMGFGHRAYKVEDPRALLLREIARKVADPRRFALAQRLEALALEELRRRRPEQRLFTNVEFYAAVVLEAAGLPRDLFPATFAVARTAGWVAHALEQAESNRLIRPDIRYTGERERHLPSGYPRRPIPP
jgi:citrate synthase